MSVKLKNYFFKVLLPEVFTCKNDIRADNKQKLLLHLQKTMF